MPTSLAPGRDKYKQLNKIQYINKIQYTKH